MNRLILIPVRGSDRVEEILPYLDDIAQPGTKITFLVHLGTRQFERQVDKLYAIQKDAKLARCSAAKAHAEEATQTHGSQLLKMRGLLRNVDVDLNFYTGSLRALTDQLAQEQRLPIVMLRPAANALVRWFYRILHGWRVPRSLVDTPVLLCHIKGAAQG